MRNGDVVAIPTETVYGLAAVATNESAIEKIYAIKKRPSTNPLICHFSSFDAAKKYLKPFPNYVNFLQRYFSPGPLSYLLPLKEKSELQHAVRGQQNIIVRIPAHPLALQILECVGLPLAAPSANTSGRYSPTTAEMVADDLGKFGVDIVNGGASEAGIESTIIDCTRENEIQILRPGSVGKKEIEDALANEKLNVNVSYSNATQPTPGHFHKHYAPKTPLTAINSLEEIEPTIETICVLLTEENFKAAAEFFSSHQPVFISIGSEHNPQTIAKALYAALFKLDQLSVSHAYILTPHVADADWSRALNYRLQKMTEPR